MPSIRVPTALRSFTGGASDVEVARPPCATRSPSSIAATPA